MSENIKFANNWEILEVLTCAEYRAIYQEMTGDTTKKIKNTHYLVRNNNCGIETYMERSTVQRNLEKECLSKCKGCNGTFTEKCYYSNKCRIKPLYKIPEREQKVKVGESYGLFTVLSIKPSGDYADHQCRAEVKCKMCGATLETRFDKLLEEELACECFKSHSTGEMKIKYYFDNHQCKYKSEYTFSDLYDQSSLRYDFALFNDDDTLLALIEFDGEQHFKYIPGVHDTKEDFEKLQKHDKMKNEYVKINNIPLLRIPYTKIHTIDEELINFILSLN